MNKESRNRVNSLSFSIWKPGEIFIGGLQGHKSAGKDLVIAITKSLHGFCAVWMCMIYAVYRLNREQKLIDKSRLEPNGIELEDLVIRLQKLYDVDIHRSGRENITLGDLFTQSRLASGLV